MSAVIMNFLCTSHVPLYGTLRKLFNITWYYLWHSYEVNCFCVFRTQTFHLIFIIFIPSAHTSRNRPKKRIHTFVYISVHNDMNIKLKYDYHHLEHVGSFFDNDEKVMACATCENLRLHKHIIWSVQRW